MHVKAENQTITRLHFAKALVKKGYVKDINEALSKYLHKGESAYVEKENPLFTEVAKKYMMLVA